MINLEFFFTKDLKEKGLISDNSLDVINNLSKINIFIGGNNSGKSRLIRGISNNILDIFNKFLSIKDVLKLSLIHI